MRILFIKIVLVLLPVIILASIMEIVARRIPTSYKTKISYFDLKKHQIEILVFGSSHSNFGINPQYFERESFNLSNTSQCLYQDYKVMLKYLPECKNVKMVIIPISYFTLQSTLSLSPEAWRTAYYSVYMGIQADDTHRYLETNKYSALFLWDGPLGTNDSIRHTSEMNINEFGYQYPEKLKLNINEIINEQAGMKRVDFHDKFMDFNSIAYNIGILDKIANELHIRKIKMVIVVDPEKV